MAAAILIVGIVVISHDGGILEPKSTTTVTKEATEATPATVKKSVVVTRKRGEPATRTKTLEFLPGTPEQPRSVTTTNEAGERTFVERVLGDVGLVLLQGAVILLAAFLGAAVIQRMIMGEYGGVEIGAFKLGDIAAASTAGIAELGGELKKLREEAATAEDLKKLDDARRDDTAAVKDDLALAYKRMDLIEKRLSD